MRSDENGIFYVVSSRSPSDRVSIICVVSEWSAALKTINSEWSKLTNRGDGWKLEIEARKKPITVGVPPGGRTTLLKEWDNDDSA